MRISCHSEDGAARSIARDDKGCLPRGGEGDDGRRVLLEGGVNRCYCDGLDSCCGGSCETTKLTKHNAVEHGGFCLEANLTHDPHSFSWVFACRPRVDYMLG